MKKTQEVLGLPVISICDGIEVGRVKGIIINAEKGAVDYIVVDSGVQMLDTRVINTGNLLGIGEHAVTVENESAMDDLGKVPAAQELLQKNIQVKGTKVLTKKGRLVGKTGDIYIDPDSCNIVGLEFISNSVQDKVRLIPRDCVITFGKDLVIVEEDVESRLADGIDGLNRDEKNDYNLTGSEAVNGESYREDVGHEDTGYDISSEMFANGPDITENPIIDETVSESGDAEIETALRGDLSGIEDKQEENGGFGADDGQPSTASKMFEDRQRQYLIGRTVTKTIEDAGGNVIISEGQLITNEIIEAAKQSGKFIELFMNNKA